MASKRKLTQKQMAFADAIGGQGMTLADAYRHCYQADGMKACSIHSEACRLAANPQITARIETLQGRMERAVVSAGVSDRDRVLTKLRTMLDGAEAESSQLRAAELLGRSCGLYTDVIEDKRIRTPEEIKTELDRRLAALTDRPDSKVH